MNLTGNQLYEYVEPYADVGFKTLAVIGGQLNLHGMPGGNSTPAWVQLTQTAPVNATNITLDQDVTGWPVGSKVPCSGSCAAQIITESEAASDS